MSTTTEDRKSPRNPALDGVPFSGIGGATELAPDTPLTREAVIHLRAAGMEIDSAFALVRAILRTVKNEVHPWACGADVTLDEDRAYDLSLLLRHAIDLTEKRMLRPCFERGRGERPHGGIVDSHEEVAS